LNPLDPLAFLFSLERLGMKFGLENISRLCVALGNPERAFASVLVAGTNGKGSVTAMTDTALRAAGHRAARYTSPHLLRLEERFVVDGAPVATADLVAAAGRVQAVTGELLAQGALDAPPTFFECTTAIAFDLFRRAAVKVAVLEVGLGGRLDATNIVTPIAAAITSIDFDHEAQLGHTIASIAREKAGIARAGIPVVCGPLPDAADAVIRDAAAAAGARTVRARDVVAATRHADGRVDFRSDRYSLEGVRLALPGRHQIENATVVIALLAELDRLGIGVHDDAARAGLSTVSWPGRLEHVRLDDTDVLFDAAHNPAGAAALRDYLDMIGWTDSVLVFGVMRDKDVRTMLSVLAPACRQIVCTGAGSARAMAADEIATIAAEVAGWHVDVEPVPATAFARARQRGGRVVVAGSIFLIGPLRDILR
jgi:dihydrofolate synthase/folylpolyglutamate synthase